MRFKTSQRAGSRSALLPAATVSLSRMSISERTRGFRLTSEPAIGIGTP